MSSKYELTISTNYVKDWTHIEAVREIFQNAKDNEIENPSNKMEFHYDSDSETLSISNRTSVLNLDSLLLGNSSKSDNPNTIGSHGEGYKIAIMVLLREGKGLTVYNKSKNEIWTTRLVHSRRFNNQLVPVVTVERDKIFKRDNINNLVIEVTGISESEYEGIVENILDLQDDFKYYEVPNKGRLLVEDWHKGKIFVKGLYVCDKLDLEFGYDFEPSLIKLDRDRKLVSDFDLCYESSYMLKYLYKDNPELQDKINSMIMHNSREVEYLKTRFISNNEATERLIGDKLASDFLAKEGKKSYPVSDSDDIDAIIKNNSDIKVKVVNSLAGKLMKNSINILPEIKIEETLSLKEEFEEFLESIKDKLSSGELDRFEELIDKIED